MRLLVTMLVGLTVLAADPASSLKKEVTGGMKEDKKDATTFDKQLKPGDKNKEFDATITIKNNNAKKKQFKTARVKALDTEMFWNKPLRLNDKVNWADRTVANFTGELRSKETGAYLSRFNGILTGEGGNNHEQGLERSWRFYGRLDQGFQLDVTPKDVCVCDSPKITIKSDANTKVLVYGPFKDEPVTDKVITLDEENNYTAAWKIPEDSGTGDYVVKGARGPKKKRVIEEVKIVLDNTKTALTNIMGNGFLGKKKIKGCLAAKWKIKYATPCVETLQLTCDNEYKLYYSTRARQVMIGRCTWLNGTNHWVVEGTRMRDNGLPPCRLVKGFWYNRDNKADGGPDDDSPDPNNPTKGVYDINYYEWDFIKGKFTWTYFTSANKDALVDDPGVTVIVDKKELNGLGDIGL